jgi:opacity protein-like surface antigen
VAPSATYNANGGGGQVEYNVNRWLGAVGDFAGYGATNSNGDLVGGAFTYLFGPRVNFRLRKVNPFAQVLLGGIATTAGLGVSGDQNNFAMTAGGGIDVRVSKYVWVRPVQAEYLRTKLPNGIDNRENNFRIGAGVVVRLVKR